MFTAWRRGVMVHALLAAVTVMVVVSSVVMTSSETVFGSGVVDRVAGSDRYQTAVEVATLVGGGSLAGLDRLIVVSGESFADGLAASGLAGFLDGGGRSGRTAILLTRSGSLPMVVRDAVHASGVAASEVVVLGGVAAVSDAVRVAIGVAAGWDGVGVNPVVRIAGEDQYGTAAAIVDYVTSVSGGVLAGSYRTVLVASGEAPFDALAAGALAYRNGHLLLLSSPSAASQVVLDAVAGVRANCVVMIGGTTALAPVVASELSGVVASGGCGVERVGGADRFSTAVQVADRFITVNGVPRGPVVVSGVGFADGLVAAPLAAGDRPLLFTAPDLLAAPTHSWLRQYRNSIQEVVVIGGTRAVSATVVNETNQAVASPPVPFIPPALNLSYATSTWTQGQVSQVVTPTLTGAIGSTTFSATGQLPSGVTFNTATGAFTGPAAWNVNATTISAGSEHSCVVLHDTTARCWGANGNGQLGIGNTTPSSVPVAVVDTGVGTTLSGITHISTMSNHTCAVLADSTARCWGNNDSGRLGDGTTTNRSVPVTVVDTAVGTTLSGITHISAGNSHTCSVRNDKTAKCWGSNGNGQLGDSTTANRSVPVTVTTSGGTALSGITHISAGGSHTCAVLDDKTARCWGTNAPGRLGDGTTTDRHVPVTVVNTGVGTTLSGITHISAGSSHTCAVLDDATARCWGSGSYGRLGDGATANSSVSVTVVNTGVGTTLSGVTEISAGAEYTCAVLVSRTVQCWGANWSGQLGDSTITDRLRPVEVTTSAGTALSNATQISTGGEHACVVLVDSTARCWGWNGSGQLGDNTTARRLVPVAVVNIGNPGWPVTVTVSVTDSAGRTSSVNATLTAVIQPVLGLSYASTTFTQGQASQAVSPTLTGAIGSATFSVTGQLPSGVTFSTATGQFTGPAAWNFNATTISAGSNYACAVLADTTARCWGSNGNGRLGDGTTGDSSVPVTVTTGAGTALTGVTHIAAGNAHTCAVLANTTARCWGSNGYGVLGDGTAAGFSSVPVTVTTGAGTALTGITQIAAGSNHTCAVLADTTARCWGFNGKGQLGDNSTVNSSVPVTVTTSAGTALTGITQISAGLEFTCAVLDATTARCWGSGHLGKLGRSSTANSSVPVTVVDTGAGTTLTGVSQIFAAGTSACALLANTTAKCWGGGSSGKLGRGSTANSSVPVTVVDTGAGTTLTGIFHITGGGNHACALLAVGTNRCWGWNGIGGLGDGTLVSSSVPVTVTTSAGTALIEVIQVSVGNAQTCALLADKTMRCWGYNGNGQLGEGTTVDSPLPVTVLNIGNPGWPATITVVVTDSGGRTSSVNVTLTY